MLRISHERQADRRPPRLASAAVSPVVRALTPSSRRGHVLSLNREESPRPAATDLAPGPGSRRWERIRSSRSSRSESSAAPPAAQAAAGTGSRSSARGSGAGPANSGGAIRR